MKLYEIALSVMKLIAMGETATMAIFTAYIDDILGYEIFCSKFPIELFEILRDDLRKSDELQRVMRATNILERGLGIYIDKAFEDCHMLYHFMDGELTILKNPVLADLLSSDDRYMLEDMFKRWQEGAIDDRNWEDILTAICEERASK